MDNEIKRVNSECDSQSCDRDPGAIVSPARNKYVSDVTATNFTAL